MLRTLRVRAPPIVRSHTDGVSTTRALSCAVRVCILKSTPPRHRRLLSMSPFVDASEAPRTGPSTSVIEVARCRPAARPRRGATETVPIYRQDASKLNLDLGAGP
ncbi:hypothetical protein MTO96_010296 [Rhipicephalus appendiculatus]